MASRLPEMDVLEPIGRRPMSEIHRARRGQSAAGGDRTGTGSECTVEIGDARCDEAEGRRIRRIAVARATATDPGLPKVLAIGTHERRPYVVTESLTGVTLTERLSAPGLDLLVVAQGLVSALAALHVRGVAHGHLTADDVKIDGSSPRLLGGSVGPPRENDFHSLGLLLDACGAGRDPRLRRIVERLLAEDAERPLSSVSRLEGDLAKIDAAFAQPLGRRSFLPRPPELDRLHRAWADARAGEGRTVTLRGPAGVGKTALARAFLDELPGASILSTSARPSDRRRFAAIERLFEAPVQLAEEPTQRRAAVLARLRNTAFSRDVPHRIAESLSELLVRWSANEPLVLFVDDSHALDSASAQVLGRVAARVADGHLLLLVLGTDPARLTRHTPPRSLEDLTVPSLDRAGCGELIQLELAPSQVSPEVKECVVRLSDATPRSTLEVTRTLLEIEALDLDWGTWRLDRARAEPSLLLGSTAELARRRVHGLGPAPERLLETVARRGRAKLDVLVSQSASRGDAHRALVDAVAAGCCKLDGDEVALHDDCRGALHSAPESAPPNGAMALLEAGATDEGIRTLEKAATAARDPIEAARLWLDLSWSHEMLLEPDAAWRALERAFAAMTLKPPTPRRGSLLAAATAHVLRGPGSAARPDPELELAAALYQRAARFAAVRGQAMLSAEGALRALDLADRTGHASVGVEARMLLALLCAGNGLGRIVGRLVESARHLALSPQATLSGSLDQWDAQVALVTGDVTRALASDRSALDRAHEGAEPFELLQVLFHHQLVESLRGHPNAAWTELERALGRIRTNPSVGRVPDVLATVVRAVLTSLGREAEISEALAGLDDRLAKTPANSAFAPFAWGARIRELGERGELGEPFERAVAEFEREHPEPKQVSLIEAEHYVHVLHGRIHAALRAPEAERPRRTAALTRAVHDLKACARIDLFEAHARVGDGHLALLSGNLRSARKAFAEAETLGNAADAPWLLYSVARGRAHLLLCEGRSDAARDQAAMAELVARSSGSAHRLRWVREEVGQSSSAERPRLARPLQALQRVGEDQQSALEPDDLLRSIVAELSEAFGARRALTYRRDADGRLSRVDAACVAANALPEPHDPAPALLHEAISARSVVVVDDARANCSRAVLPVTLDDSTWAIVCLERSGAGAFSEDDRHALNALCAQATLTLELSRRRRGAESAEIRARAAEELRAVTDFAKSVARDMGAVVGAIHESVESAFVPLPEQQLSVLSSTEKARSFVERLEAFARHRPGEPRITDLNELLLALEQALRPLVRLPAELVVNLDPELHLALTDPWVLEQLLVSLTIDARRALRGPGVVVVQSTNTELDEVSSSGRATPGAYAMVSVASDYDEGAGGASSLDAIDSWLIAGYGARVHAAGGYVNTLRESGFAQTCRICLPARPKPVERSGVVSRNSGQASVLLLVRDDSGSQLERALTLHHIAVSRVHGPDGIDAPPGGEPDAVVAEIDPAMPELAQALGDRYGGERVLFVSDHPKALLLHAGLLPSGTLFLQRPASSAFVAARIRRLLQDTARSSASAPNRRS